MATGAGVRRACSALAAALLAVVVAACSGDDAPARTRTTTGSSASTTAETNAATPPAPVTSDRVVVRGNATVDGAPFDAKFLGAVVRSHGLVTPCQGALPPVERGRYAIPVLADTEGTGCGAAGTEVLLWTFVQDKKLFSSKALTWPGNGRDTNFDANFSTSAPNGDAAPVSEFSGEVFDRNRRPLPSGTRIEAYVGAARCGIASVRSSGDFLGYILSVVGPDSIAGCARDATLTFRIDGRPATQTAVNRLTPAPGGSGGSFDLTLA